MKIITKLVVVLLFVGSLAGVSSCKDYDEDNYNNAISAAKTIDEALKKQISDMNDLISELKKTDQALSDSIKKCGANCAADKAEIEDRLEALEKQVKNCENCEDKMRALIENNEFIKSIPELQTRLANVSDSVNNLYAQVKKNQDSIVILNMKFNDYATYDSLQKVLGDYVTTVNLNKTLEDYATKANLKETLKDYATLDSLAKALENCHKKCKKYTDEQINIVNEKVAGKADTLALNTLREYVLSADSVLAGKIDSLAKETSDLKQRVTKIEEALEKQVTGIVVQQVYNPAFGSFNGILTNVQSNMLAVLYGKANSTISFPSNNDSAVDKFVARSGETLMNENEGNAGKVYLTVNPNTVDFEGLQVSLVNSQDVECAIKLGGLSKSSATLTLGYSRANNGFYVAPATLDKNELENGDLHLNIDKSAIKEALKELVKVRNTSGAKLALKDVAEVALTTASSLQPTAQGVKCGWTDMYGEHSVSSNYNMAAIAYQPLGFNSVDGIFNKESNGAYWRLYDKTKNLVTKIAKRIGKNPANRLDNKITAITQTIEELNSKVESIELSYQGDSVIAKGTVTVNVKGEDYTGEVEVNITNEVNDIFKEYNGTFNELLADLSQALKELDGEIAGINKLSDKLENASYLNKVYNYLDKAAQKVANVTPKLFKPTLLVSSDKGLGFAGFAGVPSRVSGKVVLVPTTYSMELLAPVFKKYIRVNGGAGKMVDGNYIDITDQLKTGTNTIEYRALDYQGTEWVGYYEIVKE